MNCSTPGLPVHHQIPESTKPMSIESVMPSNHLVLSRTPLLLPSNISQLQMSWFFTSGGQRIGASASASGPSNEYSGLIFFRIYWFDILVVQGTLRSLVQHHSSKASILQHSAFCMVQLWHLYMTIGKTIALTRWTFVDKVMSLLFSMLSRFVIEFLSRSKRLFFHGYSHYLQWFWSPGK